MKVAGARLRLAASIGLAIGLLADPGRAIAGVRADTLEGSGDGRRRLTDERLWKRRFSIRELEAKALHTPRDPAAHDRLGQAYLAAGFVHLAREAFERSLRLAPEDAVALFELGLVCERDWLAVPTPGAADSALDLFSRAGRARPD